MKYLFLTLDYKIFFSRHLSCIDTKCGFDQKFLELFAVHLAQKDTFNRHGILIFDEMCTRESVSVNSENLTYTGR